MLLFFACLMTTNLFLASSNSLSILNTSDLASISWAIPPTILSFNIRFLISSDFMAWRAARTTFSVARFTTLPKNKNIY